MRNTQFQTYERNARMKKRGFHFSVTQFLFVGILFFVMAYFFIQSVGSIEITPKSYKIDKGVSAVQLSEKLSWDVSAWRYKLWLKFFPPKNIDTLQAGEFEAKRGETIQTFFENTLKNPTHTDLTITILPGWNMYDIDAYLAEKNISAPGEFLRVATDNLSVYQSKFAFLQGRENLEGFLYPDTYRLAKSATANDVILKLLSEFQKKIGESYISIGDSAYKKLILASIVEREERNDAEQKIVAGILEKRVNEGIAMGADATVCVGYAKTQKQCTPAFIGSVIHEDNPYNTRAKRGYPPTPISNVPLSAWDATIHAESSPYYYYLHDSDGVVHFAKTLEEHNQNRQKYNQ